MINVTSVTAVGGSVVLNSYCHAFAAYVTEPVIDASPPRRDVLVSGLRLRDDRFIKISVDRDGLVVVKVTKSGKDGELEVIRQKV